MQRLDHCNCQNDQRRRETPIRKLKLDPLRRDITLPNSGCKLAGKASCYEPDGDEACKTHEQGLERKVGFSCRVNVKDEWRG